MEKNGMETSGHRLARQGQYAAEWNSHPIRTIVQFIADFVTGFLQDECIEQAAALAGSGRDECSASGFGEVRTKKSSRDESVPERGPTLQHGACGRIALYPSRLV